LNKKQQTKIILVVVFYETKNTLLSSIDPLIDIKSINALKTSPEFRTLSTTGSWLR